MALARRVSSRYTARIPHVEHDDIVSDAMAALPRAAADWEARADLRREFRRDEFFVGRVRRCIVDGLRERAGRDFKRGRFEWGMARLDVGTAASKTPGSRREKMVESLGADDSGLGDVEVEQLLASLPDREREIVRLVVIEGETEKAVGLMLGVSESRVSQILSRALARLRGEDVPPDAQLLTNRELEVLQRVANGMTNRQIGADMFIGTETVKSHLRHIHPKLRASSRAHAVAIAMRSGLID